ncbi:MAG: M28 family peptidase [Bacteroidales bacterium]
MRNKLTGILIPKKEALLITLGILFIVFFGIRLSHPPKVIPADAPDSLFSAERAARHLPNIAAEPNPIGTPANQAVRDYITDLLEVMDLEPELHQTELYYAQRAASLENILARLPGQGNGQTILFMGHYDTVRDAPGASDNGAAVVTMLELIRMLQHHPPLENDLIFFFPDGEEVGLLGAQAFMKEHPWAEEVDLVVNLEAMGTTGQSLLFETGENNLEIIKEFARAVPYPAGQSISVEIYKRMPNATDYDIFKQKGYQGLNFAYIGNSFDYHTGGDNIEHTDLRSIQHHGSHAAALALHLGNTAFTPQGTDNAVYFNTVRYGFASYPFSRVPAITILIMLIAGVIIAAGIYRERIRPLRLLFGFLAVVIYLGTLFAVFDALQHIIAAVYPGESYRLIEYHQQGILIGFSLLAVALSAFYFHILIKGVRLWQILLLLIMVLVLQWFAGGLSFLTFIISIAATAWLWFAHRKPAYIWELPAGAIALWTILMVATGFSLPGVSYLFTWPLLFSLVPLCISVLRKPAAFDRPLFWILLLIFAIPVLIWFPHLMKLFQLSMGLEQAGITMTIAGLMTALLIPHLYLISRNKPWLIPGVVFLAGLFLVWINTTNLDYDERHRKQNHIIYATDVDREASYWLSLATEPDAWTKQFLTDNPDNIPLEWFIPLHDRSVPAAQSSARNLSAPTIEVLADSIAYGERMLQLHVKPERQSSRMTFFIQNDEQELAVQVGHLEKQKLQTYRNEDWYRFAYYAPPEEGIRLKFYTTPGRAINLHLNVHDDSGIPDFIPYQERPPHMMASGDQSITSSFYVFDPMQESEGL